MRGVNLEKQLHLANRGEFVTFGTQYAARLRAVYRRTS